MELGLWVAIGVLACVLLVFGFILADLREQVSKLTMELGMEIEVRKMRNPRTGTRQ